MSLPIDIRHLRYFIAVAEELNFRRAAERLHLTQPPLSRQLQQLEEILGVMLLERSKSTVRLTRAGRAFLPEARKTLTQIERAAAAARACQGQSENEFIIGYTMALDRSAFPEISHALAAAFPDCRLLTRCKRSLLLIEDLQRGLIDAAFIGLPAETRGLQVCELQSDPFVVALSSHHPLARKRELALTDLNMHSVFWFKRRANPSFYDYCERYFERVGFKPKRLPEPEDHHVLLGLIAEDQGIGLIPASLQKIRRDGVVYRKLSDGAALAIRLGLAHLPNKDSAVLQKLVAIAQENANTASDKQR